MMQKDKGHSSGEFCDFNMVDSGMNHSCEVAV